MDTAVSLAVPIDHATAAAYTVPTDVPESDGTFAWDATTLVLAEVSGGGRVGLGYSYTGAAAAGIIRDTLAPLLTGRSAMDVQALSGEMARASRNLGRPGLLSAAISAADVALWDLKAKLLDLPLVDLLGRARQSVPAYGSGGFTSAGERALRAQLGGWAEQGFQAVKMKVGRAPWEDLRRVAAARDAVGGDVALLVDANGAYARKEALSLAEGFARYGVAWFEEPVSSDDLDGLRLLRDRAPAGMEVAAGEYGWDAWYFRRMLSAGAVDVLQADATRCGGVTGFLKAAALAEAFHAPLSSHTAPSLHASLGCALETVRHLEYFHDHARIESMLFDGAPRPRGGTLAPDPSRPGLGLEFKREEAERYAVG